MQVLSGKPPTDCTVLIKSSAIFRYVVHFPPRILTKPEVLTITLWCREISLVAAPASSGAASGRSPANTLFTSCRVGVVVIYVPAFFKMKSISLSKGKGSTNVSSCWVSVVPTTTYSFQGTAKRTRPSVVCGTIIA